jgi:hypothetical protein
MYRSMVVGLDDVDRSKDALALGKLIASATGASITVAGVVRSIRAGPTWREPA